MPDIHAQVDSLLADKPMLGAAVDETVRRFQAAHSVYCKICFKIHKYHVVFNEDEAAFWIDFKVDDEKVRVYFAIEKACDC